MFKFALQHLVMAFWVGGWICHHRSRCGSGGSDTRWEFVDKHVDASTHVLIVDSDSRPTCTNDISIKFEIRPTFSVLWFKMHSTDHNGIKCTQRQCYRRAVCKISLRSKWMFNSLWPSDIRWQQWSGPTFIKPDQRNPWIKDQLWNDLLSTILHLQLPNFVSCGRDKPSHMTQNLVTVGVKL